MLQCAHIQTLSDDDLARVIKYKLAFEVWNDLTITHEGTSQFKRPKINLFRSHYENYYMINSETIAEILTCFTKINNELSSLSDVIDHDQKVRKEIRALFKV